jgi:hypothetical protein
MYIINVYTLDRFSEPDYNEPIRPRGPYRKKEAAQTNLRQKGWKKGIWLLPDGSFTYEADQGGKKALDDPRHDGRKIDPENNTKLLGAKILKIGKLD